MMIKRAIFFVILLSFLLTQESRSQPKLADFDKVMWLVGTWVNDSKKDHVFESWLVKNENELRGTSYLIKGRDTLVKETIRLIAEKDAVYYIPMVNQQNEGLPIRFTLSRLTDTEMVFENPDHDFPQVISYRKQNANSLLAEIWSVEKGNTLKIKFPMKRVGF